METLVNLDGINEAVLFNPGFPISNWGHRQALMVK
jgi:hypothetical protein